MWWFLIIIECIALYYFITSRNFDFDEFESIHSGWKILNGETIYEDFIQQKNPVLYYLLAIIVKYFGETTNTIIASSYFILFFSLGILYYTYKLAELTFDVDTAKISIFILPLIPWFTLSGFQIRPDVPMLFFCMASVYYLYRYLDKPNIKLLLVSAICLSIAFIFIQKAIFWFVFFTGIFIHRYILGNIKIGHIAFYSIIIFMVYGIFLTLISLDVSLSSYFFFTFKFAHALQSIIGSTDDKLTDIFNEIAQTGRFTFITLSVFFISILSCRLTMSQWELAIGSIWLLFTVFLVAQPKPWYVLPAMPLVTIIISYGLVNLITINQRILINIIPIIIIILSFNYHNLVNANGFYNATESRQRQFSRVQYILDNTNKNDYVYDGLNRFNIFRKDIDFVWLGGHHDIHLAHIMASLRPYEYNIYKLIYDKKPKVITHYYLTTTTYPWILKRYKRSPFFEDIYIKIQNNTGFDYWYTYMDSYGIGSSINPAEHFFIPEGNIEVNLKKAARQLVENDETYLFPYVGIGMQFNDPPVATDLTDAGSIILIYKLSGPVSLILIQEGISPGEEYRVNLSPTDKYTKFVLYWSDFSQPDWVNQNHPLDLTKIKGVHFQVNSDNNAEANLGIRSIIFKGHKFNSH